MSDRTIVMVMVNGIGAHLTNGEKTAHLSDLRRERASLTKSALRKFCRSRNSKGHCPNRGIFATKSPILAVAAPTNANLRPNLFRL
jgi:hypothetical protein